MYSLSSRHRHLPVVSSNYTQLEPLPPQPIFPVLLLWVQWYHTLTILRCCPPSASLVCPRKVIYTNLKIEKCKLVLEYSDKAELSHDKIKHKTLNTKKWWFCKEPDIVSLIWTSVFCLSLRECLATVMQWLQHKITKGDNFFFVFFNCLIPHSTCNIHFVAIQPAPNLAKI